MEEDIKKILEISVNAPSGGNSQPWKFKIENNRIYIFANPEKDHPVLNYRNRGTWLAHGALIENIIIASCEFGYKADIDIFPDKNNQNLTAIINLEKSNCAKDSLFSAISLRATNRKPYRKEPLGEEKKNDLLSVIKNEEAKMSVRLIDNEEKMNELGEAMSAAEIVMFENKLLHKLMFKEVVFTKKEEQKKQSGLYVKTMELKSPQQIALRIFKYWPIMNFLNRKANLARTIAAENAKIYASNSAIGVIFTEDKDEAFIQVGRTMERLWLKATEMGLNFHLITGVPFFWQRTILGKLKDEFSQEHIKLIEESYKKITSICSVDNKIIALLFRIGYGDKPSAYSFKKPPEIIFNNFDKVDKSV